MEERVKNAALYAAAVAACVYFSYMALLMSGICRLALVLAILLFLEGGVLSEKSKQEYVKKAWLFHLLCPLSVLIIAIITGDINGYEWAERIDGKFVINEEPAENWYLLWAIAFVRLTVLQFFYMKK